MKPSVSSTVETRSGRVTLGFSLGRVEAVGAPEVDVWAASDGETSTEAAEAVVDTLPSVVLEALSSSLSVSPKSKGALMAGAASRKSNGSNPVPLPKNWTRSVHNSLQSDPAKAMNKCWRASAWSAEALCSSSAANRESRRAYRIRGEMVRGISPRWGIEMQDTRSRWER